MNLAYSLVDWQALAPGLASQDDWQRWAQQPPALDTALPVAKPHFLPRMPAGRLRGGRRAAVECGLALLARRAVDAVVFTSRHGELERNLRILTALANEEALSPTDFAMSVHNSAVGSLTIAAKQPLVSTSVSAGIDSFQQGLIEVSALHQAGYRQVLLVDFDGVIPDYYRPWLPESVEQLPYAVGLVLGAGETLRCAARPQTSKLSGVLPQSLAFLHGLLNAATDFTLPGDRLSWRWEKNHD